MTKIVNLRQARKQRDRMDRRKLGDRNAMKFGEAKPQRELRKALTERAETNLDAHRRDDH
ncbi:DUF4169 family protein [Paracoccus sp. Z330]|uniref:DUF4169 family protein n=1 Tax=Paracoccus onchidii TaxID=3017813 RepID=A0ABT4ZEN4_9RHOB|nr:DUF4169 family protein [Paracoccus onchidii]MDB6177823.1 DUF4169 family protein [Paracoccus onchidii]